MATTVPARDGFMVASAPLSVMLRGFVAKWQQERPTSTGGTHAFGCGPAGVSLVGAISYLSQESGLPEQAIKNLTRREPKPLAVPIDVADTLVTVLGHPEAFHDGTLTIGRRVGGEFVPLESLSGSGERR